jgi:hypothetical protein
LLYGPQTPRAELVRLGRAYLDRGLAFDAADFLARARDEDGLAEIRKLALESGDAFLLRIVAQAAPALVSEADWGDLGRRARELGKDAYVDRAEAGGAPPPPPLQEELAGETGGASEGGDKPATGEGKPVKPGGGPGGRPAGKTVGKTAGARGGRQDRRRRHRRKP